MSGVTTGGDGISGGFDVYNTGTMSLTITGVWWVTNVNFTTSGTVTYMPSTTIPGGLGSSTAVDLTNNGFGVSGLSFYVAVQYNDGTTANSPALTFP